MCSMPLNQDGACLLPPGEGRGEGIKIAEFVCLLPPLSRERRLENGPVRTAHPTLGRGGKAECRVRRAHHFEPLQDCWVTVRS